MNTRDRICTLAAALLIFGPGGRGQTPGPDAVQRFRIDAGSGDVTVLAWNRLPAWNRPAAREDDKNDAGYALYKEGYALVLEEKYAAARKKFEELLSKFPSSSYSDDARYWTAYSLRNSDREKAIEDYKQFIRGHPQSSYYDDAVADLNALQMDTPQPAPAAAPGQMIVMPPRAPRAPAAFGIGPSTGIMLRQMKREMQHLSRLGGIRAAGPFAGWREEEKLDDATRLKMDALYALGETREDDKSFSTLREVALDQRHPALGAGGGRTHRLPGGFDSARRLDLCTETGRIAGGRRPAGLDQRPRGGDGHARLPLRFQPFGFRAFLLYLLQYRP